MKDAIKYIAYIFVAAVVLVIALRIDGCPLQSSESSSTIVTPPDTNFAKIVKKDYRPKSIPFIENPKKPPVTLPNGIKELDVKRVIFITGKDGLDSVKLVELKDGIFFVDNRDGKVSSVEETTYLAPVVQFSLSPLAGITISPAPDQLISPMLGMTFITWYGCVQLPSVCVDMYGFSASAFYKTGGYSIGVGGRWNFLITNPQIVASIAINF